MAHDDSLSLKFTEEDLQNMSDTEKLTILVKAVMPMYSCIFGNGKVGLRERVDTMSSQIKLVWGILVAIAIVIVGEFFKR